MYLQKFKKMVKNIRKRDGSVVLFQKEKIAEAIWKAVKAVGGNDKEKAGKITELVVLELENKHKENSIPDVEEVQDLVERILIKDGRIKSFI